MLDDLGVESFKEEFWKQHIDKEKLGRELAMDSSHENDYGRENPEHFLDEEEPEDGWTDEQLDEAGEKAEEAYEERVKKDPIGYLQDIYGEELNDFDLQNYVDKDSLIEDAVNTDGVAHFIAGYDGNETELGQGFSAYRTN